MSVDLAPARLNVPQDRRAKLLGLLGGELARRPRRDCGEPPDLRRRHLDAVLAAVSCRSLSRGSCPWPSPLSSGVEIVVQHHTILQPRRRINAWACSPSYSRVPALRGVVREPVGRGENLPLARQHACTSRLSGLSAPIDGDWLTFLSSAVGQRQSRGRSNATGFHCEELDLEC